MNPINDCYNEMSMSEQNMNNPYEPRDNYRNISISAVISTSCVILEGARPSGDIVASHGPGPAGVSDQSLLAPQDEFHVPPEATFRGQAQNCFFPPCPANPVQFGKDFCEEMPSNSDFENVFESAASEFTTPGPNMDACSPGMLRNSNGEQKRTPSFRDYSSLGPSYPNQEALAFPTNGTNVEQIMPCAFNSNSITSSDLAPLSVENDFQLFRGNPDHVPQMALSTSDRNPDLENQTVAQDPMFISCEENSSFPFSRNQSGGGRTVDRPAPLLQAYDYRNPSQNMAFTSKDGFASFCSDQIQTDNGCPQTSHFAYINPHGIAHISQNDFFSRRNENARTLEDDFSPTSDCRFPSSDSTGIGPSHPYHGQGHNRVPISKLLPAPDLQSQRTAECFFEETDTSSSYNSLNGYSHFLASDITDKTMGIDMPREERDFNVISAGSRRSSQNTGLLIDDKSGKARIGKLSQDDNAPSRPKMSGNHSKAKRKHAETVESLQQQLELLEEQRKKEEPTYSSVKFLRSKHESPVEKSDEEKTNAGIVDVDHMICSGVTVAGFKPRAIIRKRSKTATPSAIKDSEYWQKRRKNNDSARKSRESKKEKEKNFYKRALELEYENFYLQGCLRLAEAELASLGHPFVPPVTGNQNYF